MPGSQESSAESLAHSSSQFRALLTPHRSLSQTGFLILMSAICLVSFGTGLLFYLLGAWPVIGFMGLDVALIYVAFKLHYRAGRLYEVVDLGDDALTVTRVQPSGKEQSWRFNPYWVQLKLEPRDGGQVSGKRRLYNRLAGQMLDSGIGAGERDSTLDQEWPLGFKLSHIGLGETIQVPEQVPAQIMQFGLSIPTKSLARSTASQLRIG